MEFMKIVTIGGGGGHAQVLKGLKNIPDIEITAICPSTDSGGSTGILSRDYDNLGYLGDLTKCIAALSPDEALVKTLLYRFEKGLLNGHSVKNLFFLGLQEVHGFEKGLELMHNFCGIKRHRVIPITREPTKLCAQLKLGNDIEGETQIDNIASNPLWHPDYHAIQNIHLKPDVPASDDAINALGEADWCVICPGDLYSSVLPVIIPKGVKEILLISRPKVVIVLNIMTKKGETDRYKLMDFVTRIEEHLGIKASYLLANNSDLNERFLLGYALEHKVQLIVPETNDPRIILAPLATVTEDGYIYHSPAQTSQELRNIFNSRP
jgi:uncharacterized cofD-like protein